MTVTRFPPSPTGYLHIGGARTALYSWLYARQHKGKFVLRIEDTDLERSNPESVQAILDGMQWLGLDYDEGPYYQTQRFDRYKEVVQQLLDTDHAYHCECSRERLDEMREQQRAAGLKPKYDGRCRELALEPRDDTVVRFKNPQLGQVVIEDLVKGSIVVSNEELDDLVIARPDGVPTYNLTVVVDDWDMGITHVIRGDDHVNNTPRQINILRALNASVPAYAHVPMILGADGARLSKRHGAVSVMQYRDDGILPEALLTYLVRLGWSHGDQELFTIEELLQLFKIENVSRAPSAFSLDKLLWVNNEKIKAMPIDQLLDAADWYFARIQVEIKQHDHAGAAIELIRDRCNTLVELAEQAKFFFVAPGAYDSAATDKWLNTNTHDLLAGLIDSLGELSDWSAPLIQEQLQLLVKAKEVGFAKLAQPIRIALTGNTNSPSIDQTLAVLGKAESLKRLNKALPEFAKLTA